MYDDNYDFYVEIDEDITLKTGIDENLIVDIIQQTIRIKYSEKMIVDITFVDKETIKKLNNDYRKIDSVTDVLSFPLKEGDFSEFSQKLLGDVIICIDCVEENAENNKINFKEELIRVIIHGVLHLLGFDHAIHSEKQIMFEHQEELLKKFL
ncbi:MAG: rRNA maturation RNase YbeY [Candidatus Muirbacterium halophilum]|nr:rRNA maturation RNase YbeY [Candidatus Muirbacterium halophilum]